MDYKLNEVFLHAFEQISHNKPIAKPEEEEICRIKSTKFWHSWNKQAHNNRLWFQGFIRTKLNLGSCRSTFPIKTEKSTTPQYFTNWEIVYLYIRNMPQYFNKHKSSFNW